MPRLFYFLAQIPNTSQKTHSLFIFILASPHIRPVYIIEKIISFILIK